MSDDKEVFMDTRPGMAECDFEGNPTLLFSLIHQKLWPKVIERAQSHRDECATWATRRDQNGKIRWRLLPLHAAIIFKAPIDTVETILLASPISAQCRDDQGMLPIHLAFRNGHDEAIINLLLMSYPNSVNVPDKKGRLPHALAELCPVEQKDIYLRALNMAPRYVAMTTASLLVNDTNKENDDGVYASNEALTVELFKLRQAKLELEQELIKSKEASKVLVSHVNSLESQLLSRADTERFLATRISNLDAELREISRNKEIAEASLKVNMSDVEKENHELKLQCAKLSENIRKLEEEKNQPNEIENPSLKMDLDKLKVRCKILEDSCENFESQLKAKNLTEQALASQVSNLLERLAASSASSSEAETAYLARIELISSERAQLKKTVIALANKVRATAEYLSSLKSQVNQLGSFDGLFGKAKTLHQQIMSDTARNEQILIDAAREREQLVYILTRQAEEIEKTKLDRERIIAAIREFHETTAVPINLKEQAEEMLSAAKSAVHATEVFVNSQFSEHDYSNLLASLHKDEESTVLGKGGSDPSVATSTEEGVSSGVANAEETVGEDVESIMKLAQQLEASLSTFKEIEG
jgi:ankyrin repeat protein